MYDFEKGIFPQGEYTIGKDIPCGKYILKPEENYSGCVTIYQSRLSYQTRDDEIDIQAFESDFYMNFDVNGEFVIIERASMHKI